MRLDEVAQQLGVEQRRVAGEDEHVARRALERAARRADRVAGAERLLLDRHLDALEAVPASGRGDDDDAGRRRPPRAAREHPVDHAPAEDRVQVLRHRRSHPGPEAGGHDDCCDRGVGHVGWMMAGAPGFEPGIAGPKPAALPLGYAPEAAKYSAC